MGKGKRDARSDLHGGVHRDRDGEKRFPNSIGAIVRAVFREWESLTEQDAAVNPRTALEFLERTSFLDVFMDVVNRFPNSKDKAIKKDGDTASRRKKVANYLEDIGTQKTTLEYARLRAVVDFLRLCEGSFFILARLISLERRAGSPAEAITAQKQYLAAVSNLIDGTQRTIESGGVFSRVDSRTDDGKEIWIANTSLLKQLVERYNAEDQASVRSLLDRI